MVDSRFEPRLLNSRACILNHYRKLQNYRAWVSLVVSEYRWQDDTNTGGKTDVVLEEWSGLWSREGRRRGCSSPGQQSDKSRDTGMAWTFTFYFIFILHRVVISALIIREGKDLTLLECGVGSSRLWGQWQWWGLKVFGGQASKSLEKWVCYHKTPSETLSPGRLRLQSPPGRMEKFRTAQHTMLQERTAGLNPDRLSGCQEREWRRASIEPGREAAAALRNSGGCLLLTHFTERCSEWNTSEQQFRRQRSRDNWAINLWGWVWN